MTKIGFTVNGKPAEVDVFDPYMPLLYALRNDLGLRGPRFGCGLGQCGACTVLLDGDAVRACSMAVSDAAGRSVVTLEGLGTPVAPHPLQTAFIAHQAAQCGYCINGMIMQSKSLLDAIPRPTAEQVADGLANNLCRCGTHPRIVAAVLAASANMAKGG